jgi:hypothetical protein
LEEKAQERAEQWASRSKYCITHKYGVTGRPKYLKKKFIKT